MDYIVAALLAWIAIMATLAVIRLGAMLREQRGILDISGMVHKNTYDTKSQLKNLNHRLQGIKRNLDHVIDELPAEEPQKERLRSVSS